MLFTIVLYTVLFAIAARSAIFLYFVYKYFAEKQYMVTKYTPDGRDRFFRERNVNAY